VIYLEVKFKKSRIKEIYLDGIDVLSICLSHKRIYVGVSYQYYIFHVYIFIEFSEIISLVNICILN